MYRKLGLAIYNEIESKLAIYTIIALLMGLGLAMGLAAPGIADENMHAAINSYMNSYVTHVMDSSYAWGKQFFSALLLNLLLLGGAFLCQLHVAAVPLLAVLLFNRAFSLGFTAAVFATTLSVRGVIVFVLAVVPQNLLLLPALAVVSANSACTAFAQQRAFSRSFHRLWHTAYDKPVWLAGLATVALAAALMQGGLSTLLIKGILSI